MPNLGETREGDARLWPLRALFFNPVFIITWSLTRLSPTRRQHSRLRPGRLPVDRRLPDVVDDEERAAQTRGPRQTAAVQRLDPPFPVHHPERRPRVWVLDPGDVRLRTCLTGVHRVRQHRRDGTSDGRAHDGGGELVGLEVLHVGREVILGDGREAEVTGGVDSLTPDARPEPPHHPRGAVFLDDRADRGAG